MSERVFTCRPRTRDGAFLPAIRTTDGWASRTLYY